MKESLQEVQRAHPPSVTQLMQDLRQLRGSNGRVCLRSGVQCSVVMYKPQFASLPHEQQGAAPGQSQSFMPGAVHSLLDERVKRFFHFRGGRDSVVSSSGQGNIWVIH